MNSAFLYFGNCMDYFNKMQTNSVDLTLTDIPYGTINRDSNGLRNVDKGKADIMTFDLEDFLQEVDRVTKGTIIIFCGKEQLSQIYGFFDDKQKDKKGTVRQLIWRKTNPSPMNGQNIYLSGVENAVWFKKKGATFNAFCKNTVFDFPNGKSKLHPTEKNLDLIKELIIDNSNEGDNVFDPCMGSGTTGVASIMLNRSFIGVEIDEYYYNIANQRISKADYKQMEMEI